MRKGEIATKADPLLWREAKEKACSEGGLCRHSARKMQWALQYYKTHGGRFVGKRSRYNRMRRWTKQKWRTATGKPSRGQTRYLPDKAWKHLSPEDVIRTNEAKRKGYKQGKQWVPQPDDLVAKTSHFRGCRTKRPN